MDSQMLNHERFTFSVFPTYLSKFQSIPNIRTRGFWIFIFENLRTPSIFRVLSLVENLRKLCHFLKNAARVEVTITINEENCTNIWAKAFVILYGNCCSNFSCNFNPYVILFLRNWRLFLQFSHRLRTRKIDGGRKFSEDE